MSLADLPHKATFVCSVPGLPRSPYFALSTFVSHGLPTDWSFNLQSRPMRGETFTLPDNGPLTDYSW